jgi:hypothetical protein
MITVDLKTPEDVKRLTWVAVYAIMGGVIVLILNFSPTGGRVACFSFFSKPEPKKISDIA